MKSVSEWLNKNCFRCKVDAMECPHIDYYLPPRGVKDNPKPKIHRKCKHFQPWEDNNELLTHR